MINVIAIVVRLLRDNQVAVTIEAVHEHLVRHFNLQLDWVLLSIVLDRHFSGEKRG